MYLNMLEAILNFRPMIKKRFISTYLCALLLAMAMQAQRPVPSENQLRELLTNYGEIFEVWFDGANGGDGWYGGANETRKIDRTTYYQWPETYKMIAASSVSLP